MLLFKLSEFTRIFNLFTVNFVHLLFSLETKDQDKKTEDGAEEENVPSENAAGEDIPALVSANFDGKRYWCSLCKIVCLKSKVRLCLLTLPDVKILNKWLCMAALIDP